MRYVIDLPQSSSYEPPSKQMKYVHSSGMCVCSLFTCVYLILELVHTTVLCNFW